eukprot:scaffold104252_cov61-Phaeocystis_antarctica.AAC.4
MTLLALSPLGAVLRFRGGSDSVGATSLIDQLQSLKATVGEPKLIGLLQRDAALRENVEELERSLRHTLDGPDDNGLSRLHCATIEQDAERCESLLRAGADPEARAGSVAVRPLHLAVLAGDQSTGCLRSLLRAGAAPNARDSRGTTALHAAAALNLPHTASLLLEYGASPRLRGARGVRALQLAGAGNAAEAAQVLLSAGAEVDATDARGRTASHAAAKSDASEVLELLHEGGADLGVRDRKGRTPLHHAVRACHCTDPLCGRTRALQFLLGPAGCAALPRDRAGWTPLHVAAEHERIAAMKQLLAAPQSAGSSGQVVDIDVDAPGPHGCTPLMLAAHSGARRCTAALLEAHARVEERDEGGATALCAAAAGRRHHAMTQLLQAGADAHSVDDSGSGVAFFAAQGGSAACVRLLREAGADLSAPNSGGWSPLHAAANSSHLEAVMALCEAGAAPHCQDGHGWTPLMLATNRIGQPGCRCKGCVKRRARSLRCMRVLLRKGAACDAADSNKVTAAHLAAACDSAAALRLLRQHGADLWCEDGQGNTPLQVARATSERQPSQAARLLVMMAANTTSIDPV